MELLGGKVRHWQLPVLEPASGVRLPALKRLQLPQGELAQIYDDAEGIRYLAAIELRQGTTRGNHFHKVKQEWIYLLAGETNLVLEDPKSRERANLVLRVGDLAWVMTDIAHALQSAQDGLALEFSTARFDPADTFRWQVV